VPPKKNKAKPSLPSLLNYNPHFNHNMKLDLGLPKASLGH